MDVPRFAVLVAVWCLVAGTLMGWVGHGIAALAAAVIAALVTIGVFLPIHSRKDSRH